MIFKASVNQIAKLLAKNYYARKLGIWAYEDRYLGNFVLSSVKLFMESYFDLTICVGIQLYALYETKSIPEFISYFSTP